MSIIFINLWIVDLMFFKFINIKYPTSCFVLKLFIIEFKLMLFYIKLFISLFNNFNNC